MTSSNSKIERARIADCAINHLISNCGFQFETELGKGSYGTVIKVKNSNGESLAAKIVERALVNRFEISEWPEFQHENVLKLLNIINEVEEAVIFMTSVLGSTLFYHLLNTEFRTDTNALVRCKTYAMQVLSGMSYLHRKELCHLDLRAENVLMTLEGDRAVITDFSGLRRAGVYVRHFPLPRSMRPPEILGRNVYAVSPQPVDLWSCGLLLGNIYLGKRFYMYTVGNKRADRKEAIKDYMTYFSDRNCVMSFVGEAYTECSMSETDAKRLTDLLRRFLQENPLKRIKTDKALSHPFFLNDTDEEPEEDSLITVDDIDELQIALPELSEKKVESIVSTKTSDAQVKKKKKKWFRYFRRLSKLFRTRSFFRPKKFKGKENSKINNSEKCKDMQV